jgi:hypothetical protein
MSRTAKHECLFSCPLAFGPHVRELRSAIRTVHGTIGSAHATISAFGFASTSFRIFTRPLNRHVPREPRSVEPRVEVPARPELVISEDLALDAVVASDRAVRIENCDRRRGTRTASRRAGRR